MLRLLLIFHLIFRLIQGLTQSVDMCDRDSTSFDDGDFILYTSGPQCTTRTCSCSISIEESCVPASFQLTFDRTPSNKCKCSTNGPTYNVTLIYMPIGNSDNETLSWTGERNKSYIITVASETFSIFTTYSGCNASLTFSAVSFNDWCGTRSPIFTVNCQAPTSERTTTNTTRTTTNTTTRTTTNTTTRTTTNTTTRTTTTSATADATATPETTTGLSSTGFQSGSKSSASANNKDTGMIGMIVGIVVGVVGGLILLIVVIVIVVIMRRRRAKENASAKRTVSIPNAYELPSAAPASNGRVNYQPLNVPTQPQNTDNAGEINQYDNFNGRNNEAFSPSSVDTTDYYNAAAASIDNGITAETTPVDNSEVTVIENSLYR